MTLFVLLGSITNCRSVNTAIKFVQKHAKVEWVTSKGQHGSLGQFDDITEIVLKCLIMIMTWLFV